MNITTADFYDLLMPELPGCTAAMVDLHLVDIVREFCDKTDAWTLPFDPVDLVANEASYDIYPPESQAEIVRLVSLTIAGVLLWEDTDRRARASDAAPPRYQRNEAPFSLSSDLRRLTLAPNEVPTATAAGAMALVGSMRPIFKVKHLPGFLKVQYSEALRFGTLSRLMAMSKKPWTDRELARHYFGEYQQQLNFAAHQAQVGNTREHLRVRKWG